MRQKGTSRIVHFRIAAISAARIPYIARNRITNATRIMQTFELLALVTFLTSYLLSALRAIATPEQYRDREIEFYRSGKPGVFELVSFVLTGLALGFLIVHFVLETPKISQLLLYGMIIIFDLMMPFHFFPFFRDRMASSLKQKTADQYRSSGLKRLAIAALIILLPLIYR
jgi:hypothetical protein